MSVIYSVNCRPLLDIDTLNDVLPDLSQARRQKISRLVPPLKRAQYAAAGLLTNHLLNGADIAYDDNGRPFVPLDPDTHISLSHTDDWVFCAVSDAAIGIDAQVITPRRQEVVNRLFSQAEQSVQTDEEFTQIWSYKEAYYKLLGRVSLTTLSRTNFACLPTYDTLTDCYYRSDCLNRRIYLTACVRAKESLPSEIIELSITDLIK